MSDLEYVALNFEARKRICIQRLLNKLLSKYTIRKIEIFKNNKTSLILTKDPKNQNCIKYINVIHHQL